MTLKRIYNSPQNVKKTTANTTNNVGKSATQSNSEVTKELIQSEDGKENHIHSWEEANICTGHELVRKKIHKPR